MDLACEGFDLGQSLCGRVSTAREHHHVGLTDRLARPGRGIAIAEIDHQPCSLFELVEPIGDFGGIQRSARKCLLDADGVDDLGLGGGQRLAHALIEDRWNRLASAVDQRHRSCHR